MSSKSGTLLSTSYATPGEIIAASIVLPIVSIIVVLLRFYCRSLQKAHVGIDDWLLIPALVTVIGIGVTLVIGVKKRAIGYPTPPPANNSPETLLNEVTPETKIAQQVEWANTLLLILAYSFIKVSIVSFYRRLFVTRRRNFFDLVSITTIAVIIVWGTAFFFYFLFDCGTKFASHWGSRLQLSIDCGNGLKRERAFYISEFIINIILLVLPLPTIWKLKMKTSRKLGVCGILLLAFVAFIASIVRLVLVIQASSKTFATQFDVDQTISTIFYWGIIEAGLAITASCLPTLPVLLAVRSIQSVVQSARSMISLQSIRSHRSNKGSNQGSKGSKDSKASKGSKGGTAIGNSGIYAKKGDSASEGSQTGILYSEDVEHETGGSAAELYTMHEIAEPTPTLNPGKINIKREFSLNTEYVV